MSVYFGVTEGQTLVLPPWQPHDVLCGGGRRFGRDRSRTAECWTGFLLNWLLVV